MPREQKAGEAIAAGGYGCVFKPPIKCRDKSLPYEPTGISKLMSKTSADDEMREIAAIKPIISTIPNNQRYFLVNKISQCKPANLTNEDKKNFDTKCHNMRKRGLTAKNVNKYLDNLSIINIPYGGKDLNSYQAERIEFANAASRSYILKTTYKETLNKSFAYTNYALTDLLKNGIVEMNKRGLYHCDIKAGNILRDGKLKDENPKVRLIDWGLATIHKKSDKHIPNMIGVIQFNVPFSNILFNLESEFIITDELDKIKNSFALVGDNKELGKRAIMQTVAIQILAETFNVVGEGHRAYVRKDFNEIYKPLLNNVRPKISLTKSLEYTFNTDIIIDYLAEVLTYYVVKNASTDEYKFNAKKYLEEVYLKNVDIWGFLMAYLSFLKIKKDEDDDTVFDWSDTLTNSILRILMEYCFNPKYAVTPIPVDKVIEDLKKLNTSYVLGVNVPRPATPVLRTLPSPPKATAVTVKKSKVCPPGKEINPKTGRCINIKKPKATRKVKPADAKATTTKPVVKKTKKLVLKSSTKTKAKTLKVKKVDSISSHMRRNAAQAILDGNPLHGFAWPGSRRCPKGSHARENLKRGLKLCIPNKKK